MIKRQAGNRVAGLAAAMAVAVPVLITGTSQPAAACEFATYQYVVTGESVTLRNGPDGAIKAVLHPGDLVNSGISPDQTGWLVGNAYTPSKQRIDDGWVLRHWTSYTGNSWCG